MKSLVENLFDDIRIKEGLKACINCGTCTAICPAASFYDYDPRELTVLVQNKNEQQLKNLLSSDYIWYCGECMSCKTRCPKDNVPGLIIEALRSLSQDTGLFIESEKGRQQLYIKRVIGGWILKYGYCLYLEGVGTNTHPEQGPVWDWRQKNWSETLKRLGANYKGDGPGILRKIPEEALEEIRKIFDETGATARFNKIEEYSKKKAAEMNLEFGDGLDNEYFHHISTHNSNKHNRE